jgi:hypothetical protein
MDENRIHPPVNPAVVKKERRSLLSMWYGRRDFKLSCVPRYADEMVFVLGLAAEARLVVTAQNSGTQLSFWVDGTPDELDAFFSHMKEVREEKWRKAEAVKFAKKQARELVKQAEAADYSNPTPGPIVAKPRLVKPHGAATPRVQ